MEYFHFGRGDFHVLLGRPSVGLFGLYFLASWNKVMSLTLFTRFGVFFCISHNHCMFTMHTVSCMPSKNLHSPPVFVHLPFIPFTWAAGKGERGKMFCSSLVLPCELSQSVSREAEKCHFIVPGFL